MKNREITFIVKMRNEASKALKQMREEATSGARAAKEQARALRESGVSQEKLKNDTKAATNATRENKNALNQQKRAAKENTDAINRNSNSKRRGVRDTRIFKGASDQLASSMRRTATTIAILDGPLGGIASRFSALGTLLSNTGILFGALALAVSGAVASFGQFARIGANFERQMLRTQSLLRATGNVTNTSVAELEALAESVGDATLASTQDVRDAIGIMLTFRGVGREAFEPSIRLAQDLAEVMGTDIRSASQQLGRALEDPVRGMTALRRSGVSFTDSQKEMVEAMVRAGDTAGAQQYILERLEQQFGGAGEAAAQGLAGGLDTFRERFVRFFEVFSVMSGSVDSLAQLFHNTLNEALQFLIDNMDQVVAAFHRFMDILRGLVAAMIAYRATILAARTATMLWTRTTQIAAVTSAAFGTAMGTTTTRVNAFTRMLVVARRGVRLFTAALAANPLGAVAVAISLVVGWLVTMRNETFRINGEMVSLNGIVQEAWSRIWNYITQAVSAIRDALRGLWQGIQEVATQFGISGDNMIQSVIGFVNVTGGLMINLPQLWSGAFRLITETVVDALTAIVTKVRQFGDVFSNLLSGNFGAAREAAESFLSADGLDFSDTSEAAAALASTFDDALSTELIAYSRENGVTVAGEWADGFLEGSAARTAAMEQAAREQRERIDDLMNPDAPLSVTGGNGDSEGPDFDHFRSLIQGIAGEYDPLLVRQMTLNQQMDEFGELLAAVQGENGTAIMEELGLTMEQVLTIQQEMIEAQERLNLELGVRNNDVMAGLRLGIVNFMEDAKNMAEIVQESVGGVLNKMSDAFADFVTTGKLNFKELARSIIADLARIAAQQAFFAVLNMVLPGSGSFLNMASQGGKVFHTGGLVGAGGAGQRQLSQGAKMAFAAAPRFHSGGGFFKPGEVPAILQTGERVLNRRETARYHSTMARGAMTMAPNVSVSVNGNFGGGGGFGGGEDGQDEMMAKIGDLLGEEVQKTVHQVLQDEARPGGMLDVSQMRN